MLTKTQIELIQESFRKIAPRKDSFADAFYGNLFSRQPALRILFPENLDEQKKKLMQMLSAAVNLLDKTENLLPILEELGRRHALYGVRDEYYQPVGATLLQTLKESFGEAFDSETEKAWAAMYEFVSETMQKAALELSSAPNNNKS
jgi:Hemoglobin-like flavoprotein